MRAPKYVGKSHSCMVINGRLIPHASLGWRHYAAAAADEEHDATVQPGGTTAYSVHCTLGVQMPRWIDLLDGLFHSLGSGGNGEEGDGISHSWLRQPLPCSAASSSSALHATEDEASTAASSGGDTTTEASESARAAAASSAAQSLSYSVAGSELLLRLESVVEGLRTQLGALADSRGSVVRLHRLFLECVMTYL